MRSITFGTGCPILVAPPHPKRLRRQTGKERAGFIQALWLTFSSVRTLSFGIRFEMRAGFDPVYFAPHGKLQPMRLSAWISCASVRAVSFSSRRPLNKITAQEHIGKSTA
jgi:hypothetical protein